MNDCIFCKLARGDIPSDKILDVPHVFIIRDRAPLAPEHFLVIATEHHPTLKDATGTGPMPLLQLMMAALKIGSERCPNGYRLMVNTGKDAGQTVPHAHIHVIGGGPLRDHPDCNPVAPVCGDIDNSHVENYCIQRKGHPPPHKDDHGNTW